MVNQNNQEDMQSSEHSSFYDQADEKFNQAIEKVTRPDKERLAKGVTTDADSQVRETEDASLQDDSYSFDEANTDNEEYHDADDGDEFDPENDDDYVQ